MNKPYIARMHPQQHQDIVRICKQAGFACNSSLSSRLHQFSCRGLQPGKLAADEQGIREFAAESDSSAYIVLESNTCNRADLCSHTNTSSMASQDTHKQSSRNQQSINSKIGHWHIKQKT